MKRLLLAALAGAALFASAPAEAQQAAPPRRLRVLLVAGGPTREYQLLRNHFARAAADELMELSIHLQTAGPQGGDGGIPPERLLPSFPTGLQPAANPAERYLRLAEYDLLVALDPDWRRLQPRQLRLLEEWVHGGGGLILVSGSQYSHYLCRAFDTLAPPLQALLPVELGDDRLTVLKARPDARRAWAVKLTPAGASLPFLKLNEGNAAVASGWDEFFWGDRKAPPKPGAEPLRGFFSPYPVRTVRPGAVVLAAFEAPQLRINQGHDPLPFLVAKRHGAGRVFYLDTGETWRLRLHRVETYERFWTLLARHAAAGAFVAPTAPLLVVGDQFTVGDAVAVEARLPGKDRKPLPAATKVTLRLTAPAGVKPASTTLTLQPRRGGIDGDGWFQGRFQVKQPGAYRLSLQVPDGRETLSGRFEVKAGRPLTAAQRLVKIQEELALRYGRWERALQEELAAAAPEARNKANLYKRALALGDQKSVLGEFGRLIEVLNGTPGKGIRLDDAVKRSKLLTDALQGLALLLKGDPHAAALQEMIAGQQRQTEALRQSLERREGELFDDLLRPPGPSK